MRASTTRGRPGLPFLFGVAGVTLAVDQGAKAVVVGSLEAQTSVSLAGAWIRLTLVHNTGSAFGLVSSGWALIAVSAGVCLAVLLYVTAARGLETAPGRALPLGLVLGGSLGNLLDRVRTGGVTDFIDLRVWPVFNVADIAITVGILLLATGLMRRR